MDLHIHTCLSPCADQGMVPTEIVEQAKLKKIDAIAICDHNSAENVFAVQKAARNQGLVVFGGFEITTCEEVHVLALFEDADSLKKMQKIIDDNLHGENDEKFFGQQFIVDEADNVVGSCNKLLIGATTLSIEKIVGSISSLGGITIAAHIDREHYGIIGQLGFIPDNLSFDALEISPRVDMEKRKEYAQSNVPIITSSDAHYLSDIGKTFTRFYLESVSFKEIRMAFGKKLCRKIEI